jgi:uncharacterized membrane protein YfcA
MPDGLLDYLTLCLAAVVAGAINSIGGGGTLLTFPALFAVLGYSGEAAVVANATSTVALCPGSLAAMWGYRRELTGASRWIALLIPPSVIGGYIGSRLLVELPGESFKTLVPWLILAATLLLGGQPLIARWTGVGQEHAAPTSWKAVAVVAFQFLVAVYGGYFGAGIGILMLAALAMMGMSDIHRMNGLKTLFAFAINSVSVVVFIVSGAVDWRYAPVMIASAVAGGYMGARVARRLDKNLVRRAVVVLGFALAGWYFLRG